jgi:hypothetical protein
MKIKCICTYIFNLYKLGISREFIIHGWDDLEYHGMKVIPLFLHGPRPFVEGEYGVDVVALVVVDNSELFGYW